MVHVVVEWPPIPDFSYRAQAVKFQLSLDSTKKVWIIIRCELSSHEVKLAGWTLWQMHFTLWVQFCTCWFLKNFVSRGSRNAKLLFLFVSKYFYSYRSSNKAPTKFEIIILHRKHYRTNLLKVPTNWIKTKLYWFW